MITRLGWLISGQDHISIAQIIHTEIILNLVCVGVHLVVHAIKGALLCLMRYSLVGPEDPVHGGAADQQDTRTQQEPLKGQSVRQSVSQSYTRTQQEPPKGQSVRQSVSQSDTRTQQEPPKGQSVRQSVSQSDTGTQQELPKGQYASQSVRHQDAARTTWKSVSQSGCNQNQLRVSQSVRMKSEPPEGQSVSQPDK